MEFDPARLTATEAAALIRDRRLDAVDLVAACLDRIVARDGAVRAFAYVDPDHALRQAEAADALRRSGAPLAPLHGVPIGLADIIDTGDMPTQCGSVALAGRRPEADAAAVGLLRAAGAIILGKTATTELAAPVPAASRNPRNPDHAAGGSCAGSAAAVADAMVPLALGIETLGEVVRSASYCGVHGYKPSFGSVPRTGSLLTAATIDTMGVFARSLEDLALLGDILHGHDPGDPATRPRSRSTLTATMAMDWPIAPTFALVKSPDWSSAALAAREAIVELCEELGSQVVEIDIDATIAEGSRAAETVRLVETAAACGTILDRGAALMADALIAMVERGRGIPAVDYLAALQARQVLYRRIEALFVNHGTVLTLAASGPAPDGQSGSGSPAFGDFWSFVGAPAVSLPLFETDGLPIGVQLVGARGDDGRLLRSARLLLAQLATASS
jgi:Asp-tRNA(Asn)/Glu-tRNA(Gln) amidotransferase A subunit family amidase